MKLKPTPLVSLLTLALAVCCASRANAHFVWVYGEDGKIKVVFGEGPEPGDAQFIDGISGMKAFSIRNAPRKIFKMTKQVDGDSGWYEAPIKQTGNAVGISCQYGVFARGDSSMLLDYGAKYILMAPGSIEKPSSDLALDIVPEFKQGELVLTAWFHGKVVADVEIVATREEHELLVKRTNDRGVVSYQPFARYRIRAKHVTDESGEVDGKEYSEHRFYCTLILDIAKQSQAADSDSPANLPANADHDPKNSDSTFSVEKSSLQLKDIPIAMTSFGGVTVNNKIYLVGGKNGQAHSYAKEYQNGKVFCLDLVNSKTDWEVIDEQTGTQGLALVSHKGKLYRIGGLEARNSEGEPGDLHSVSDFLEFDPAKKTWRNLPSLPRGRSSFAACVIDDTVFVVGGWTMNGQQKSEWCSEMLTFDLGKSDSRWTPVAAVPFRTRALAVGSHHGKLVVVGGIRDSKGPTNVTYVFDLKTKHWTSGPELPTEGPMKAFGCSVLNLNGNLLASTHDGGIYCLADDEKSWQKIHQIETGRFFHQMLPVGKNQFALIGGANMGEGQIETVETFQLNTNEAQQD